MNWEQDVKTSAKWMAVSAGAACGWYVGRALIGNAAGVVAAVLSDFEARRTDVPAVPLAAHRTVRTPSTKLPPRLKADIDLARSGAEKASPKTVDLTEVPVS